MLVAQFWPIVGGAENQARRLAAELVRQGASAEVWTGHWDASWPREAVLDGRGSPPAALALHGRSVEGPDARSAAFRRDPRPPGPLSRFPGRPGRMASRCALPGPHLQHGVHERPEDG